MEAVTSHPPPLPIIRKAPSPIKVPVLEHWLRDYPDKEAAQYLSSAFKFGFHIPAIGNRVAPRANNLSLVRGWEYIVQQNIHKEVAEGRVPGPFAAPPVVNLRVSPLGVVLKKTPGEFRLIHHLSFTAGGSVNDRIPQKLCSIQYTLFDAAVCMVQSYRRGRAS